MKRGQHQSLCKDGDRSARWIASFSYVKKVILGRSEACRHHYTPGTIRLSGEVSAGFKMKIYGGKGVTDGYIYLDAQNKEAIRSEVAKKYGEG